MVIPREGSMILRVLSYVESCDKILTKQMISKAWPLTRGYKPFRGQGLCL